MPRGKDPIRFRILCVLLVLMIALPIVVYLYTSRRAAEYTRQLLRNRIERKFKGASAFAVKVKKAMENSTYDFSVPLMLFAGKGWGTIAQIKSKLEKLLSETDYYGLEVQTRDGRMLVQTSPLRKRSWGEFIKPEFPDLELPQVEVTRSYQVYRFKIPSTMQGIPVYIYVDVPEEAMSLELWLAERKGKISSLQIALICVSVLSLAAAYVLYLHERAGALRAELERERQLAYVGRLAASLAHEIRNPLSSIRLTAQLLLRKGAEKSLAPRLERICDEAVRLEQSLSNFLFFSRSEPLKFRKVDLGVTLREASSLLEPLCQESNVSLELDIQPQLGEASIDPEAFSRAVRNIVLNSVDALKPDGGRVTISARRADSSIIVEISDTGPGIPEEIRDRIFEEFFTTKEGGTGLGLAIARRIIREHSGQIHLENSTEGATFVINIPQDER